MSLSIQYSNHSASAEMYREYHPGAILAYKKLGFMSKLMHPTILSAFKAGLLGKQVPLLPFKIEVITCSFPYPILCLINPSSPSWDKDACAQVEKILRLRPIGIMNQAGKSISSLGLDQIWTTRHTSVYRAEVVQQKIVMSPTGSSDLFSVRKRLVSANGIYTDDYVDSVSEFIEGRVVARLSEILQDTEQSKWPSVIKKLKSQRASLNFVNLVVYDDTCVHPLSGHCLSQALINCGFRMPLLFVRKMARLFANALECLYSMIVSSGCKIKHTVLMARFHAQLRAYAVGRWIRSVRDSVVCPPVRRCEIYSSSSSSDDERDPVIFDRFGTCGQFVGEEIQNPSTVFLGNGIGESGFSSGEEEQIGVKFRASNVVSPGPVSFSLLRRDAYVKKIKTQGVQYVLDRKSDQKFSRLGNTLVEPGDLIRVDIRKKSAEPIDPSKKRTSRAMSVVRRGFRSVKRSLSPSSSSKKAPTRSEAPDQWVRLDWVVYEKSKVRKGSEFEWHVVQSYRLKREEQDYEAPGFVVPLQVDVRYAVLVYQNAIGSDNQWIYKGMRVFDIEESYKPNKYRTVPFNKEWYLKAMQEGKLGDSYHPSLSRGRYPGFAPFMRRLPGTQTVIDYFPVSSEDPQKRNTGTPCLLEAWDFFDQNAVGGSYREKSQYLSQLAIYLKLERIANVVYAVGRERTVPFPLNNNRRVKFDELIKEEEESIPEMNAQDCASLNSAKPMKSLPQDDMGYVSSEETVSSSDETSGWLEGTILADVSTEDQKIPYKKGQKVFANPWTYREGKIVIYKDENDNEGDYVPQSAVSILNKPSGWQPELLSESIGRLFGERYSGVQSYSASLRERQEKRDSYSSKQKLAEFNNAAFGGDLGYLTKDQASRPVRVQTSSAPQPTVSPTPTPPSVALSTPTPAPTPIVPTPVVTTGQVTGPGSVPTPAPNPTPVLGPVSSSGIVIGQKPADVGVDLVENPKNADLDQLKTEIADFLTKVIEKMKEKGENSTNFEAISASLAGVENLNEMQTALNKVVDEFVDIQVIDQVEIRKKQAEIDAYVRSNLQNKADSSVSFNYSNMLFSYLQNVIAGDTEYLNAAIGCGYCDEEKRKMMKKTGLSVKKVQALVGCPFCGGRNKKKNEAVETLSAPIQKKMKASKKKVTFDVYLENGKKETSLSVKKGKTFDDLKEKFFKNRKYRSFKDSYSLVVKVDQSDPGKSKVEELPSKDLLFLKKENITMQRSGSDVIGSMLETASSISDDIAENVGLDLSKHGHQSMKSRGGKSNTKFMDSDGLNGQLRSTNFVLSEIGGEDESLIGLNRNVFNETPISTDHVLKRCTQVAKNRVERGDTRNYTEVLEEMKLAFDAYHCVNSDRVLIFRRTINGSCREGVFAALRLGELVPIGSKFLRQNPQLPAMAYDADALYFLRMFMDPIDNDVVFEQVLDNHKEFIFALGFIVLRSETPMTQEEMQQYAKACYKQKYPKKGKTMPPPPLPRCDYETFWEKLMRRRSDYQLPSGFRDAILEPTESRTFNQTYGSLQGLPNAIGFSLEDGQSGDKIGANPTDPEVNEEGTSGFSDFGNDTGFNDYQRNNSTPASGFSDVDAGGFEEDSGWNQEEAASFYSPATSSSSSSLSMTPVPSSPSSVSSRQSLKKAQDALNQKKEPNAVTLTVTLNGEMFIYDPLGKVTSTSQNYKTKAIILDTMTLREVLQAFSDALWNDYNIDAPSDCMVVRPNSLSDPVISKDSYDNVVINNSPMFKDPSHVILVIKNGNDVNSRGETSSVNNVDAQASNDAATSSTSIMDQLLGNSVEAVVESSSQSSIGCHYLEDEHVNFHQLWNRAVADGSGQFFARCPEHRTPIFAPNCPHLVVVPRPTLFNRWCALLRRGEAKFSDYLKSRTFMLPSGFTSHSRSQVINSVDGKHCLNIRYKFKPRIGRHCVRVNKDPWIPLRQLNLGENSAKCQVYAIPYDSPF